MNRSILLLSTLALFGCDECEDEPGPHIADNSVYADTLGGPMRRASADQKKTFARGQEVALRRFTTESGLGPSFNVSFCGACHEQPVTGGSSPRYRDFMLVGNRLSDGSYVGLGVNGVMTQFNVEAPHRQPTPNQANAFANRSAIPFFGVGAIAAIDEAAILANVDEDDRDNDGISGRANYDRGFVGRFGRKSQTVSIEGFIRGPLFNHIGITSNPLSEAKKAELPVPSSTEGLALGRLLPCFTCQAAAPEEPVVDDDGVADPELSEEDLFDLVSFAMLLGAPEPDELNEQTTRGQVLFAQVDCANCHTPELEGPHGHVALYSDLLLHDMGDDSADGVEMGVATGNEFRTQPLWGVTAVGPYMHDGVAETLEQAIRAHGGESDRSVEMFEALTSDEQEDLIAFVASLGGASERSDGLLAPNTPVPATHEWGGPETDLAEDEAKLFEQGRAEFDRNALSADGLGADGRFNGDSCRACHFDPVIGGAGPAGVNVTRQGIIDGTVFMAPADGTMVHRFAMDHLRPEVDPASNVIELRQTPPIFGLGLVDRIDADTILALEDPDDDDGDGVSGRAHVLSDGRVGRFGWKSGIPTLEDFVRDALSNEVGYTLPFGANFVAGSTMDDDGIADPELAGVGYEALVFFNTNLSAPPRGETGATEARGEGVFDDVLCHTCHVPSLATSLGQDVELYSDLLLHDVAPSDYRGIADGAASMREFRTPPLWGIRASGPYMHDGLSPTLDHAILRHEAEGEASVAAYKALSEDDRMALLAFLGSL